jgi:hypothetical protein
VAHALAAVAVFAIASRGQSQEPDQIDAGTFEHRVGETYAGTETFAVRERGEGLVAVGRVTREGGPEALRSFEVGLRLGQKSRPERYEFRTREGSPVHIVVSRTGSRLRVTTTSAEGERFTEHLAHDGLLILEREIAHHYGLLAARLRSVPNPRDLDLEVLVPEEGRRLTVRVDGMSRDTLPLGPRRVAATRFDLAVGGEPATLWLDPASGSVLRVSIPGRGWSASRVPRP